MEQGTPEPASPTVTNKLIRNVHGEGKPLGHEGMYESDTWLGMPGTSHFKLVSDEGAADAAPRGLALLSAVSDGHATNSVCSLSPFRDRVGVRGLPAPLMDPNPPHPFFDVAREGWRSPRPNSGLPEFGT